MLFDNVSCRGVIHRFLERACNYRRERNSSEVLLALRDVDLREGRHVGTFSRGGPLASFQGNIPGLMNDRENIFM